MRNRKISVNPSPQLPNEDPVLQARSIEGHMQIRLLAMTIDRRRLDRPRKASEAVRKSISPLLLLLDVLPPDRFAIDKDALSSE
jgi:hypothetical protein